ncbi:MAG TPA: PIN domain-containing protein [archaeon]|nr:PIN domain-containing protein [archaeon]
MSEQYFFDTYALFEMVYGNKKYDKYAEAGGTTTIINLAELNYGLKKEFDKETADKITERFSNSTSEITINDVKEAMTLKISNKKLSIPDTIGYVIAKNKKMKFVTGDEDFKNMNNVEFVKK